MYNSAEVCPAGRHGSYEVNLGAVWTTLPLLPVDSYVLFVVFCQNLMQALQVPSNVCECEGLKLFEAVEV